ENYKNNLFYELKNYVSEYNVVYPQNWSSYPKGFDVTDWIESGHNKNDLKIAISDKWDYKQSRYWRDFDIKIKNEEKIIVPKKTWRNVEQILKRNDIFLKYNLVSNEAEATGHLKSTGDELIIDIQTLCINNGLNVNKDIVCDAILKVSRQHTYNPFTDYLKKNKNSNHKLIEDMFNCIVINNEFISKRDTYFLYFKTWLMNLVTMSQNTIKSGYKSQGVLVFQGKQGARKSTFFKKLIANNEWFKGEADIDPKNKDSVWQNTGYVLVELSEFDGMSKKDQESMKRFLTNDVDVYRVSYAKCHEKHPRITTFCATVNPMDFLKDKTGSRRFWIIPIEKCNIEAMEQIDVNQFWGAVYDLWTTGTIKNYLDENETDTLLKDNTSFNMESNISIAIDENFDFNQSEDAWKVYKLGEIAEIIKVKETKAIKNELERRRLKYGTQRDKYSNRANGFKLPNIDTKQADKLLKSLKVDVSPIDAEDMKVVNGFFNK
ncbi:MAG: VapE family protein, partial [Methanobacterium sp.]|nr:VapE family protein [Methanobacterium sp.]